MRRPTLALVLLVLAPVDGFAQTSSTDFDDLPAPPQLELSTPCFHAAASHFLQELPSLPSAVKEPPESPPAVSDPWDNLRSLRQGQQIRILDANSRKVSGRFLGLSDAFMEFQANGKAMTVAREDVVMVSLLPPSKAKRVLLGILGGALGGMNVWAEADRQARYCWDDEGHCSEEERGLSARSAAISIAVGATASGLAAALVKPDELVIYYREWKVPYYQAVPEADLWPEGPVTPEGGNFSAPVGRSDGDQASQDILDTAD
jgi:hypothetical protein